MKFSLKLLNAAEANNSWLCVGLDPDINKIPDHLRSDPNAILKFNKAIINATSDLVCAYKPNSAFYESLGADGWKILHETIKVVPDNIPVILDFKRGDIGNTAAMYAKSAFEIFGVDAVTVSPYMGNDSIEPFTNYTDKGIFVLCLTSNPSAAEIQKQFISIEDDGKTKTLVVYHYMAKLVQQWNRNKNIGLVVGATLPGELKEIRGIINEDMPILIPGIGAQGGDLEQSIENGSNSKGQMAIINVARGVIYADNTKNYAEKAREAALNYQQSLMEYSRKKLK
jgi:orotidine-5'-phosphate decarboxylase